MLPFLNLSDIDLGSRNLEKRFKESQGPKSLGEHCCKFVTVYISYINLRSLQGSILEPLLFLLSINDFLRYCKAFTSQYAVDTTILLPNCQALGHSPNSK